MAFDFVKSLENLTAPQRAGGQLGLKSFQTSLGDLSNYKAQYTVDPQSWYKVFPYQISIIDDQTGSEYLYSLPIPPESLVYAMVPASQATASLGGVVEETSETVFWNIMLAGTTGIAVSRLDTSDNPSFRNTFDATGAISKVVTSVIGGASGFLQTASGVATAFQSAAGGNIGGMFNALAGSTAPAPAFTESAVQSGTSTDGLSNGFSEVHKLHLFLNLYAAAKERFPDRFRLYFSSVKDNLKWQVVLKNFEFQKNVNQPLQFKYRMAFQGFNMVSFSAIPQSDTIDRFGPDGDLASVNPLNVTGTVTRIGNISNTISKAIKSNGASLLKVGIF